MVARRNVIVDAALAHLGDGKEIIYVTMDKKPKPTKVIFVFREGEDAELELPKDTEPMFKTWWKELSRSLKSWSRIKLKSPEPKKKKKKGK